MGVENRRGVGVEGHTRGKMGGRRGTTGGEGRRRCGGGESVQLGGG